jgi:hypothetical protein
MASHSFAIPGRYETTGANRGARPIPEVLFSRTATDEAWHPWTGFFTDPRTVSIVTARRVVSTAEPYNPQKVKRMRAMAAQAQVA